MLLAKLGISCIWQSLGPTSQIPANTARQCLQTLCSVTALSCSSSQCQADDPAVALGSRLYPHLQRCLNVPRTTQDARRESNTIASGNLISIRNTSCSSSQGDAAAAAPTLNLWGGLHRLQGQHDRSSSEIDGSARSSDAGPDSQHAALQHNLHLRGLQAGGGPMWLRQPQLPFALQGPTVQAGSSGHQLMQLRYTSNLSRRRVPKSAAINTTLMPNTTQLQYGIYGIRALTERRVAANTIEAVRRTLRRRLKKTAALWVRMNATVPVTRKPLGIRMGKGKGAIEFYACAVRPGQIVFEMDRVSRKVALAALESIRAKFPCKLGFVEWS